MGDHNSSNSKKNFETQSIETLNIEIKLHIKNPLIKTQNNLTKTKKDQIKNLYMAWK